MGVIINLLTLYLAKASDPHRSNQRFKNLQLVSSALLSIGFGLNDSQKVMGIIAAALIAYTTKVPDISTVPEWLRLTHIDDIHVWVPFSCFTVISLGTLTGGWKIIKTMGNKITKITPVEGFSAQTASALTLFFTQIFKVPVSTTHVVTGSIIGVGSVKRLAPVRWGVTRSLMVAWIITIPISALIAALVYYTIGMLL